MVVLPTRKKKETITWICLCRHKVTQQRCIVHVLPATWTAKRKAKAAN